MYRFVVFLFVSVILMSACTRDRSKPNIQYTPDMYVSIPYEPYGVNTVMSDSMAAQTPPAGAIARGKIPYAYENNNAGYEAAKEGLQSPLEKNAENLANGKKMYNIYCAVCHGVKGDGKGELVENQKFFGVPAYKDRPYITDGSIYHVIYYGRNMMGSHASQLTEKERWQVVQYVQKLKNK